MKICKFLTGLFLLPILSVPASAASKFSEQGSILVIGQIFEMYSSENGIDVHYGFDPYLESLNVLYHITNKDLISQNPNRDNFSLDIAMFADQRSQELCGLLGGVMKDDMANNIDFSVIKSLSASVATPGYALYTISYSSKICFDHLQLNAKNKNNSKKEN